MAADRWREGARNSRVALRKHSPPLSMYIIRRGCGRRGCFGEGCREGGALAESRFLLSPHRERESRLEPSPKGQDSCKQSNAQWLHSLSSPCTNTGSAHRVRIPLPVVREPMPRTHTTDVVFSCSSHPAAVRPQDGAAVQTTAVGFATFGCVPLVRQQKEMCQKDIWSSSL